MKYFTEEEINNVSYGCNDGFNRMSDDVLQMFDELRARMGCQLNPTCAFRTKEWDIALGRSGNSDHCRGDAMDIRFIDMAMALKMVAIASELGFNAFGLHEKKRFVHIGLRETEKITTWNY